MKKLISLLAICTLLLSVTGCGEKEKTTTCVYTEDGYEEKIIIKSKGESILTEEMTLTYDGSILLEVFEDLDKMDEYFSMYEEYFNEFSGITATYEHNEEGVNFVRLFDYGSINLEEIGSTEEAFKESINFEAALQSYKDSGFDCK